MASVWIHRWLHSGLQNSVPRQILGGEEHFLCQEWCVQQPIGYRHTGLTFSLQTPDTRGRSLMRVQQSSFDVINTIPDTLVLMPNSANKSQSVLPALVIWEFRGIINHFGLWSWQLSSVLSIETTEYRSFCYTKLSNFSKLIIFCLSNLILTSSRTQKH